MYTLLVIYSVSLGEHMAHTMLLKALWPSTLIPWDQPGTAAAVPILVALLLWPA
jgi:hypothetical protein